MTKDDLVNSVQQVAGLETKASAQRAVEAVFDGITQSLARGEDVTVTGFGTFRVSKRQARTGVNPRNPTQKIQIPAMKVPSFKAGKTLKDAVR